MTKLSPAFRKAAILVSTLDDRAADALLEPMGADVAARVRSALVELDDISAAEQQAVLAEFLAGRNSSRPDGVADRGGVELEVSTEHHAANQPEPALAPMPNPEQAQRPFAFLAEVPPAEAARVLAREAAQTIAVVLARLDAALAAPLLAHLPPSLATDALERLASLEQPAAEVVAHIEEHLKLELAAHLLPSEPPRSLAKMQALLVAMDADARNRVLIGLGQRNGRLVRQLGYEEKP